MSDTPVTAVPKSTEEQEQRAPADSAATLHLCAGVHVDRSFRDKIIRKIHNDARHRVAPSYGFDLVPVVRHAWRSWWIETTQLAATLVILAATLVLGDLLTTVTVVSAAVFFLLLMGIAREVPEVLRHRMRVIAERWGFDNEDKYTREKKAKVGKLRIRAMLFGLVVAAATPLAVSYFLGMSFAAAAAPAVVAAAAIVACAIVAAVVRQLLLNAVATTRAVRPENLTRRESVIDEQQNHLCVIYHRPSHREEGTTDLLDLLTRKEKVTPFLGSGWLVNRWLPPLTVQLLRPGEGSLEQREYSTAPFKPHNLIEALRTALTQLSSDTGADNLPELRVRDRIYIAADDFPVGSGLLDRDLGRMEVWKTIDDHRSIGHHFLETSVPIYGGELVATVLIRVSLKGRSLSLDVATCAITRTPRKYHSIDWYGERGTKAVLRAAMRSVATVPVDIMRMWRLLEAPSVLIQAMWARRAHSEAPRRRTVRPMLAVRQDVADDWENAQLDRSTIYDHMKIIEQRILKATEDFLRDRGVDTSAFESRATNIINNGMLNMGGGQMTIDQLAIGMHAQLNNFANGGGSEGAGS